MLKTVSALRFWYHLAWLLVFGMAHVALAAEIASPDGRLVVDVTTDNDGAATYSVRFRNEPVVTPSRLGLRFLEHHALEGGLRVASTKRAQQDATWEQPWGERRRVRNHYNELTVRFESTEGPQRFFDLRVRVYDDGLGFRYEVPHQDHYGEVGIAGELTEFCVPEDATAFWTPARAWNRYEHLTRTTPVAAVELANTPMTMRLASGTHLSLHEAALRDYSGYVIDQRRPGVLRTNLTPASDGVPVRTTAPFVTPWRTIQVAERATGLLDSSLILNLNEPNVLGDVSWVEPGKYIGIWWAMHIGTKTWGSGENHGATTAAAKRHIDFAAEHGFDGVLVEGWNTGWDGSWFHNGAVFDFTESYPDFDLEAVGRYALDRGVRLIGHHETSGHVTNYESQMADAFDLYESVGVRQVKTGYVADGGDLRWVDADGVTHHEWHDGQFAVRHFERVLVEAAKRRISINTHEPVKDTGLRRTYPNWLSREGARGQEFNAGWSAEPNPPEHDVMLAYTRMLGGPMDFTPGIFDLAPRPENPDYRIPSTLMRQLALYVVLYSPVQMAADLPENYAKHPDAFQFIRDVPVDWEKSVALAGEVGDYVVYARQERGAEDWYLGAITDEQERDLEIALTFLADDTVYEATVYRDGDEAHWQDNPYDYVIEQLTVAREDSLELGLAAGGGAAVRFRSTDEAEQE